MLTLKRRRNEQIVIICPNKDKIIISEIFDEHKIGIAAPPNYTIMRKKIESTDRKQTD